MLTRIALRLAAFEHDSRFVRAARALRRRPASMQLQRAVAQLHRQTCDLVEMLGEQPGDDLICNEKWSNATVEHQLRDAVAQAGAMPQGE